MRASRSLKLVNRWLICNDKVNALYTESELDFINCDDIRTIHKLANYKIDRQL